MDPGGINRMERIIIRIGFGWNTKGKGKHWNEQMVKMYQAKCYPTQNRINRLK